MDTLILQEAGLIEHLEQVATTQNTTPEELLNVAVREFLDRVARQKITKETEAFEALHPQLKRDYLGQYVAIHNAILIDHDEDLRDLHLRVRQKFGRIPILLRQVNESPEQEPLIIRSPRLEPLRP